MRATLTHPALLILAMLAAHGTVSHAQRAPRAWLDEPRLASWNAAGQPIPAAPQIQDAASPRCRDLARPPQSEEDKRVRDRGWDLVDAFQGGWQVVVVRGTAGYDGMCRPIRYQDFVFVRGIFAGTLAPAPMDSRTDGALGRVWLQGAAQLTAEYSRYATSDPLCCPSRITRVTFDIAAAPPVVGVRSVSTSQANGARGAGDQASRPLEGTYWKTVELAGKPVSASEPRREAHLQFQAGRVSGSDGCNRIAGSYQRNGDGLTFRQVAGTQMACLNPAGTEAPFRAALSRSTHLALEGDRLQLFDAAGTQLAAFAAAQPPAASAPAGLAGTSWQLVKFEGGDDTVRTPDDRAKYTLEFGSDGRVAARVDCNRGRGTWTSERAGAIALGPLALTRAVCASGSLHDQVVKHWASIRSYVIRDGHLFLSLMADGGIYEFEPMTRSK